jgi:hypothetical protein
MEGQVERSSKSEPQWGGIAPRGVYAAPPELGPRSERACGYKDTAPPELGAAMVVGGVRSGLERCPIAG